MWWANRKRSFNPLNNSTRLNLYKFGINHSFSPLLRLDAQLWRLPVTDTETAFRNGQSSGQRIGLSYNPNHRWEVTGSWLKDTQQNQTDTESGGGSPLNQATSTFSVKTIYKLGRGVSLYLDAATEKRSRNLTGDTSQRVLKFGLEYKFENIPGAETRNRAAAAPNF